MEPILKTDKMMNLLNRWTVTAVALLCLGLLVVLPNTYQYLLTRLSGAVGPDRASLPEGYAPSRFERLAASTEHPVFSVDQVAVESITDGAAKVGFALRAYGSPKDYPALTVSMRDGNNQVRRTVLLAPGGYEHGSAPGSETAHLVVAVQPGETRITISPGNAAVMAWIPPGGVRP